MKTALTAPQFTSEKAAVKHLEASRWPNGVTCPHCGSDNVHRMGGKTQAGMFQCNDCRDKFTARTGTVMERSHIPVHKWLLAIHLISSSKAGMSAHQLHRMLGITYKSAWFLSHRIREAMTETGRDGMGGHGGEIQADETYYGGTSKRAKSYRKSKKKNYANKARVVALVDKNAGKVRAFKVKRATAQTVRDILFTNASRKSVLVTDDSPIYDGVGRAFADHQIVKHTRGKYVNKDGFTTNNIENFFGTFKRGMRGVYRKCDEQHVQRYLTEFEFRHNNRSGLGVNDTMRAEALLKGVEGKRLTYRRPNEAANA